jgi:hypothetical protein
MGLLQVWVPQVWAINCEMFMTTLDGADEGNQDRNCTIESHVIPLLTTTHLPSQAPREKQGETTGQGPGQCPSIA